MTSQPTETWCSGGLGCDLCRSDSQRQRMMLAWTTRTFQPWPLWMVQGWEWDPRQATVYVPHFHGGHWERAELFLLLARSFPEWQPKERWLENASHGKESQGQKWKGTGSHNDIRVLNSNSALLALTYPESHKEIWIAFLSFASTSVLT